MPVLGPVALVAHQWYGFRAGHHFNFGHCDDAGLTARRWRVRSSRSLGVDVKATTDANGRYSLQVPRAPFCAASGFRSRVDAPGFLAKRPRLSSAGRR